jgi:hypothetical protein
MRQGGRNAHLAPGLLTGDEQGPWAPIDHVHLTFPHPLCTLHIS